MKVIYQGSNMKSFISCKLFQWPSVILLSMAAFILSGCGGNGAELKACLQATSTGGVSVGSGLPGDPAIPEPSSGYKLGNKVVSSVSFMAVTANPRATQAGCEVLNAGGTAADAAVAVQMVLGLVEPQ